MEPRTYTTRRIGIVDALAKALKKINGTGHYATNLYNNVSPRLLFWDEVKDFPAVHLNPGQERREYQGGGYKDRFLSVMVRCYVEEEDAATALAIEKLFASTTPNSCSPISVFFLPPATKKNILPVARLVAFR